VDGRGRRPAERLRRLRRHDPPAAVGSRERAVSVGGEPRRPGRLAEQDTGPTAQRPQIVPDRRQKQ
jgi:hypothetical protein